MEAERLDVVGVVLEDDRARHANRPEVIAERACEPPRLAS